MHTCNASDREPRSAPARASLHTTPTPSDPPLPRCTHLSRTSGNAVDCTQWCRAVHQHTWRSTCGSSQCCAGTAKFSTARAWAWGCHSVVLSGTVCEGCYLALARGHRIPLDSCVWRLPSPQHSLWGHPRGQLLNSQQRRSIAQQHPMNTHASLNMLHAVFGSKGRCFNTTTRDSALLVSLHCLHFCPDFIRMGP